MPENFSGLPPAIKLLNIGSVPGAIVAACSLVGKGAGMAVDTGNAMALHLMDAVGLDAVGYWETLAPNLVDPIGWIGCVISVPVVVTCMVSCLQLALTAKALRWGYARVQTTTENLFNGTLLKWLALLV